jgi:hypothetical protein
MLWQQQGLHRDLVYLETPGELQPGEAISWVFGETSRVWWNGVGSDRDVLQGVAAHLLLFSVLG